MTARIDDVTAPSEVAPGAAFTASVRYSHHYDVWNFVTGNACFDGTAGAYEVTIDVEFEGTIETITDCVAIGGAGNPPEERIYEFDLVAPDTEGEYVITATSFTESPDNETNEATTSITVTEGVTVGEYTASVSAPTHAAVGDTVNVTTTVCCDADECPPEQYTERIHGPGIANGSMTLRETTVDHPGCIDVTTEFRPTDPGEYTFEAIVGDHSDAVTIVAEGEGEPPDDPEPPSDDAGIPVGALVLAAAIGYDHLRE